MAIAIGFLGALCGSLLGYLVTSLTVCRGDGGAYGESCGMGALIIPFFGVVIGAVIGIVVGAIVGYRLSKRPAIEVTPGRGTDDAGDP